MLRRSLNKTLRLGKRMTCHSIAESNSAYSGRNAGQISSISLKWCSSLAADNTVDWEIHFNPI